MAESLLFVYGSLQIGQQNHHFLQNARLIGVGVTLPVFELLDLGAFPGMVEHGRTAVSGEVYEVDDEILARVDGLEGHPHFYVRTRIKLADGLEVWTYLLHPGVTTAKARITSGDWKRRSNRGAELACHQWLLPWDHDDS